MVNLLATFFASLVISSIAKPINSESGHRVIPLPRSAKYSSGAWAAQNRGLMCSTNPISANSACCFIPLRVLLSFLLGMWPCSGHFNSWIALDEIANLLMETKNEILSFGSANPVEWVKKGLDLWFRIRSHDLQFSLS